MFSENSEKVWKILINTDFSEEIYNKSNSDVEWLEHSHKGSKSTRKSKIIFRESLPTFIQTLLKREKLSYEQTQELDHLEKSFLWSIRVRGTGGKVKIHGSMVLKNVPNGCERNFIGEIEVKVPFIGRRIEKEIIKKLQQGQENLSLELERWLAQDRV